MSRRAMYAAAGLLAIVLPLVLAFPQARLALAWVAGLGGLYLFDRAGRKPGDHGDAGLSLITLVAILAFAALIYHH